MLQEVRVSTGHSRYFAHPDGSPFIPVGLNLCFPRVVTREQEILAKMEDWIGKLAANGGNYFRLWLSHPALAVEHETSGVFDESMARRVDHVLAYAGDRGVYVNVCLEHFRSLTPKPEIFPGAATFGNPVPHVSHGGAAENMDDFWQTPRCRARFMEKLGYYADRWGRLPHVFLWELWNEVNAVEGKGYDDWTRFMLRELKARLPNRLATQSLGSWSETTCAGLHGAFFAMPGNDVSLVHRYLDEGGHPSLSRGPVDLLSADAMSHAMDAGAKGPVLLGEGGAVEPHHAAPWRHYVADRDGIIFHDVLFAPFFAGSAGTGMIWHWDMYVDQLDLWHHLARFQKAIRGFNPVAQHATPARFEHPELRIHGLLGNTMSLYWVRDIRNDWHGEFEGKMAPRVCAGLSILARRMDIPAGVTKVSCYDPWRDGEDPFLDRQGDHWSLPDFKRSLIIRVEHEQRA